ncbi:MAG: hypothetical protein V4709_02045 [Pseudomonadota bacterium]
MKNAALITLLAVTLGSCASPGGGNGPYSPATGSTYERQVIGALGETKVRPEQRQAVLAAYDVMAPRLKQNDADELRMQRRWETLDPHAADYQAQVDVVAQQAASLAADRLKALAQFNQAVAATLDAGQWSRWSLAMRDERAAFENARRLDPTFRPGER